MSFRLRLIPALAAALACSLCSCAVHLPDPQADLSPVRTPVASAGAPLSSSPSSPGPRPDATAGTAPIYLLADNLHTGLVFDQKWLEESGYVLPAHFGKHQWVTMSWGEETAYRQRGWLNPFQALRALGTPSASVMEIIPFDWKVPEVCLHQRIYLADVPRSRGPALTAFLNACAVKDDDGRPKTIDSSSWGEGRLIRCPGNYSYYFPRICNVWTTQCLTKCGFTFNTSTSLLANGVIRQATSPRNGFRKIWGGDNERAERAKLAGKPVIDPRTTAPESERYHS